MSRDDLGRGSSHGQGRNGDGQFTQDTSRGSFNVPMFGNEPLEIAIGCKVSNTEKRFYDVMFWEHRKQFGWKCKSDMLREMYYIGRQVVLQRVKNPDPELTEMVQQAEQLLKIEKRLNRHRHVETMIEGFDRCFKEVESRKDYGAMRSALKEMAEMIRDTKDPVIKESLRNEFERRWGRTWQDLNQYAALPIDG